MIPTLIPRAHLSRLAALAAAGSLTLALAACGGSSSSTASSSPSTPETSTSSSPGDTNSSPAAAEAKITIDNFQYSDPGKVAPGTKVMVTNNDTEAHTVTADGDGGFDITIQPGKTVMFKAPSKAGSYPYHCTFHSNMHGTLQVG